jgi:hypothetical protein
MILSVELHKKVGFSVIEVVLFSAATRQLFSLHAGRRRRAASSLVEGVE